MKHQRPGTVIGTIMLLLVFILACSTQVDAAGNTEKSPVFSDVTSGEAAAAYIYYMAQRGLVSGFPDGTFQPGGIVTRAQMAQMLVKSNTMNIKQGAVVQFKDVRPDHWAYKTVSSAVQSGFIAGYPDGTFRPEAPATRAEVASMLLRLTSAPMPGVTPPSGIRDLGSHWALSQCAAVLDAGIMNQDADGMFAPDKPATRADVVRGLALMLTLSPDQNRVSLTGTLVPKGQVQIKRANGSAIDVTSSNLCSKGDTIVTGSNGTAELNFPDGSGLKIKENTRLTIKEARGCAYIMHDGKPGTMVDMLELELPQGQVFGALASSYHNNVNTDKGKESSTAKTIQGNPSLLASLNLPSALAAGTKNAELPWYQNSSQKKVRVKVDMPWGVAAIRGTFWNNLANSDGSGSTSVLTGECQVTAGGQTVTVSPGQSTSSTGFGDPPSPPVPMPLQQQQQWNGVYQWFLQTTNNMQGASPLQSGPPSPQSGPGTPPGGMATELLNTIHQTSPQFGFTPPPASSSRRGGGGGSTPSLEQVIAPAANPAPGTYGEPKSVTLTSATAGAEIWYTLDSTDPRTSGTRTKYTEALTITETKTVKAYAVKNGMTDSDVKTFSYIIDLDSAAAEADKNALQIGFAEGDSPSSITLEINLPHTGANGSEITWSSSNETAVSATGAVTRADTDQNVTLTATITKGNASTTKTFDLIVKAFEQADNYSRSYPVMAYDPENNRYLMVYFKHALDAHIYNLYGRLVAVNGDYIGGEFSIRTSQDVGDSFDFRPDVAYDSASQKFLVVWNENNLPATPWDIYGQIINPDGSKSGEPFAITDINDGKRQTKPFVAFDNVNNKFLVAYRHHVDDNDQQDDIYSRFVSIAEGSPVFGSESFLIAGGDWNQDLNDIAFNGTNEFMLPIGSYQDNRLVAVDTTGIARRDAYPFSNTAYKPSLAFDNVNNRFLAAWFADNKIYSGFITQNGTADGGTAQLSGNNVVEGYGNVSVCFSEGMFYVAWEEEQADNNSDIFAKTINSATQEISPQMEIAVGIENTHSPVFCGSNNGALLTWTRESEPAAIGLRHLASPTPASFTAVPQAADITLPDDITVSLTVDKAATAYYAVVQEDKLGFETPAPTAQQLKHIVSFGEGQLDSYGVVPVLAAGGEMLSGQPGEQITIPTTDEFKAMGTYTVYIALETGEGIFSEVASATFNTLADNNQPVFNQTGNATCVWSSRARSFIINEKTIDYDEKYDLFIWVVKVADAPATVPSAADVKANGQLYEELISGVEHHITYTGLDPETDYQIYMVAQDYSGEGLYSDVLVARELIGIDTVTTLADNQGPGKAGISDDDCYVFRDDYTNDILTRNKYLEIQFDENLYVTDTPEPLGANIYIYDDAGDTTLTYRGDTVEIDGATIRITFANPPAESFQLRINSGALQDTNTNTNDEINISVVAPDITAPLFDDTYPKVYPAGTSDNSIAAEVCFSEDVAVFWVLLPAGAADPEYESSIVDHTIPDATYGSMSIDQGESAVISITGLEVGTDYDLWFTAVDGNHNYMTKQKITLTTTAS